MNFVFDFFGIYGNINHPACINQRVSVINNEHKHSPFSETREASLNKILQASKCDDISCIVREDQLIKQFGAMQLEKDGEKNAQFISQKMRELGRLVKGPMEIDNIQAAQFLRSR